eukprot:scaffold78386_cov63-Phaeocystis_antarctica.AAC.5
MAVIEPNELRWLLTDPDASKQMHVVALARRAPRPAHHAAARGAVRVLLRPACHFQGRRRDVARLLRRPLSAHRSDSAPVLTVHRATPKVTRRPSSPPPPLRDGEPTALTPAQAERSSEGKRRALEIKSRSAAAQAVALAHAAASSEA